MALWRATTGPDLHPRECIIIKYNGLNTSHTIAHNLCSIVIQYISISSSFLYIVEYVSQNLFCIYEQALSIPLRAQTEQTQGKERYKRIQDCTFEGGRKDYKAPVCHTETNFWSHLEPWNISGDVKQQAECCCRH